ncbi:MAG TPA: hypothetical protein VKE74_03665 [Gemmataceae bacterium]|nr:hypothetical protein [Gemmataceae bacterium]
MSGTDRWWEQPPATGDAFQAGHRAGAAWLQRLHPKKREEMARRLADRVRWNPVRFLQEYGGELGPAYAVYRALFGTPTVCEGEYSFGGPYVPEEVREFWEGVLNDPGALDDANDPWFARGFVAAILAVVAARSGAGSGGDGTAPDPAGGSGSRP